MEIGGYGMGNTFQTQQMDRQTFGAAVVAKTLDYMNDQGGGYEAAPMDKQTFGAAVVSKTLDYMNSGSSSTDMGNMSQTYDFSKSVLGAYAGTGAITNKFV